LHWITAALGILLAGFLLTRLVLVATIGRDAASQASATAQILHLPAEVAFLLKIISVLVILDASAPLVWAFVLSLLGRRVRWKSELVGRIIAVVAFFFLKPMVMMITGRAVDAQAAHVQEIDPDKVDLFDPVDGKALVGYVEDAEIHFYNRITGHRPSDNREIFPVTPSVVNRYRMERRAAEADRKKRQAEEAQIKALRDAESARIREREARVVADRAQKVAEQSRLPRQQRPAQTVREAEELYRGNAGLASRPLPPIQNDAIPMAFASAGNLTSLPESAHTISLRVIPPCIPPFHTLCGCRHYPAGPCPAIARPYIHFGPPVPYPVHIRRYPR
jgi:hypothetical protein